MPCLTREENAHEAMAEADRMERIATLRKNFAPWARDWAKGDAYCPRCKGSDLNIRREHGEGSTVIVEMNCCTRDCDARWKVELRESAIALVHEDDEDGEWFEFADHESAEPVTRPWRSDAETVYCADQLVAVAASAELAAQLVRDHHHIAHTAQILRESIAALDSVSHQVHQMKGLFTDEDGAIRDALSDADDATRIVREWLTTFDPAVPNTAS